MSVPPSSRASAELASSDVLETLPSAEVPFFFSSATRTLVARDEGAPLVTLLREKDELLRAVDVALRNAPPAPSAPVIVGALPFSFDAPVRLFRPSHVERYGAFRPRTSGSLPGHARSSSLAVDTSTLASDEARHFLAVVRQAVAAIHRRELEKVVLARVKHLELPTAPQVDELLRVLRRLNPASHVYALRSSSEGPSARTLVGASPELLVSRRGREVVSAPLAGSAPRSPDSAEDRARAERLARSAKDLHEHRFVVERILDCLRPYVDDLRWSREPEVTSTPSMWHLATRIEGRLVDPSVTSLRLALDLHPTPAVCGTPTEAAAAWIAEHEGFDRGHFTGAVGYEEKNGDGEWIVSIRCAELEGQKVRVFAGAGIVGDSEAEAELLETEAKMRTMLAALGVQEPS